MVDEIQRQRQTPQSSNALDNYYGWNSSMGRDVRNEPSLPPQFQYRDQGRTVVSGNEPAFTDMGRNRNVPFPQSTGTPNFRHKSPYESYMNPYYGAPGQPSRGFWEQMRTEDPSAPQLKRPESFTNLNMLGRPDLAFKYSHMDPSQNAPIRGTYRRTQTGRTVADRDPRSNEMDEYGYLKGAPRQRTTFSEGYMDPHHFNAMYDNDASMTRNRGYDDAIFRTVDPNTNQIEQFPMAEGIETLQEQAAVDPSDWRTIEKILLAGGDPGTETALNIGDTFPLEGLGRQRPYGETRDMGPQYEELKTIPLDLQFDQWGYPIGQDDWGYIGAARGGLMSLRR